MGEPGAAGHLGPWTGPFLAASLALLFSGAAKLRAPRPAVNALRAVGIGAPVWTVRALAVCEMAAGAAAILAGGRPAAGAVAGLYSAFVVFLVALLRAAQPVESCGCLGEHRLAPNGFHLGLVAAATVAAGGAALRGTAAVPAMVRAAPPAASFVLLGAAVLVYAAFLVATELATALSVYRPAASGGEGLASKPPTRTFSIGAPR